MKNVPKMKFRTEIWKRFIDPRDWNKASRRFPDSPWKLYLKPSGFFPHWSWTNYKRAVRWVLERSSLGGIRPKQNKLTVQSIMNLNSLVLEGAPKKAGQIFRGRGILSVCRTQIEVRSAFSDGLYYKNPDGLLLRVEGFWPLREKSLDFFCAFRSLEKSGDHKPVPLKKFRNMLYKTVDQKDDYWRVYFLICPDDVQNQLDRIVKWYDKEVDRILLHYTPNDPVRLDEIVKLAVKMQRYIDITHVARDGSARTSKLVQDYVCLQFGVQPPEPVLMDHGDAYILAGSAYLPLEKAIQMAKRGLN